MGLPPLLVSRSHSSPTKNLDWSTASSAYKPPNPTSSSSSSAASISLLSARAPPPFVSPSPASISTSSPSLCSHCAQLAEFPSTAACVKSNTDKHSGELVSAQGS